MNTEEKLEEMENNIEQIMSAQKENSDKLDEVLDCLKGNAMGGNGLVKDFYLLKDDVQKLKDDRNTEKTKSDIYIGIIKWLAAVIAALVIAYMFNQVYNQKQTSYERDNQRVLFGERARII